MIVGIVIDFSIDDKELIVFFKRIRRRLENFRPLLKRFQGQMIKSFTLNFEAEGRPQKWKRLKPGTIARRRGGGRKILQDTGKLRASVIAERAPGNITKFSKNSLRMGSSLVYASPQQKTRTFVVIQDEDITILERFAIDYITGEGNYGD